MYVLYFVRKYAVYKKIKVSWNIAIVVVFC